MKFYLTVILSVFLIASSAFGQKDYNSLSLTSVGEFNGVPEGGLDMYCDDFEDLVLGPLDGQVSASGVTWGSFDGTVEDASGNQVISQTNTFFDDGFAVEIFADVTTTGMAPLADAGLSITFDATNTDLTTDRFYAPQDANNGIIFSRLGDPDGDGDYDVLETDGAGGGVFFDTGAAIPTGIVIIIVWNINDLDMEIFVNGTMIYSGGIIGVNGDVGITPGETLTSVVFQSANNSDASLTSTETIDNFALNMKCGDTGPCSFELGDVNNDGSINLLDVQPFVNALPPGDFVCEADINGDGAVTLLDVAGFVTIISGG